MLVPWVEFDRAFSQAEALQRQVNALLGMQSTFRGATTTMPRWSESEEAFELSVDLPGLDRDDVELAVQHRHLTLKATRDLSWPENTHVRHRERRSFSVENSWTLPVTADVEHTSASMTDGVLTVRIPKLAEASPRRIEVNHG